MVDYYYDDTDDSSRGSDDDDSVALLEARQRYLEREARELERHDEQREQYDEAKKLYEEHTQSLCRANIKLCPNLQSAIDYVDRVSNRMSCYVFARDKPCLAQDGVLKYKKSYLVGTHGRVFQYCSDCGDGGLALDEVVLPDVPVPLFFDIEIKQRETAEEGLTCNLESMLVEHCRVSSIRASPEELGVVVDDYLAACTQPFDEGECVAGLSVIDTFVRQYLNRLLGADVGGFNTCSGCRPSKFSLHMVAESLYCDSVALSAPLLTYEIARRFHTLNLQMLLAQSGTMSGDERRFRLKALMLHQWCSQVVVEMRDGQPVQRHVFRGKNDGPFDEGVASHRHLMRCPGATKATKNVPSLTPVGGGRFSSKLTIVPP